MGIVRGKEVCEFHESGSIRECFLALFISSGIFTYKIAWIVKVFLQTMAKKVIRETFLPQMIPIIRYSYAVETMDYTVMIIKLDDRKKFQF